MLFGINLEFDVEAENPEQAVEKLLHEFKGGALHFVVLPAEERETEGVYVTASASGVKRD